MSAEVMWPRMVRVGRLSVNGVEEDFLTRTGQHEPGDETRENIARIV